MTTEEAGAPPGEEERARPRARRIRPYAITGGRTRARVDLAVESLVEVAPGREGGFVTREQQSIRDVCRRPVAVAEVAARTALPLGVVRVLLDDLVAAESLLVHGSATDRPDHAVMARVLDGLRRL